MAVSVLVLRATVLWVLILGLAWAFRSRAASTRHLFWTLAFAVLILLPVAMYWLPILPLPVLPESLPSLDSAWQQVAPPTGPGWAIVLAILWAAGSLASLGRLMIGWRRLAGWIEDGQELDHPEWRGDLAKLRRRLGIGRAVRLVSSESVHAPLTAGVWRPVLVLPADAMSWSEDRRRAVLIHELVHVWRHDVLRQVISRVALAIYWFHPLSRLACRWWEEDREKSCDQEVLAQGTLPSSYASHLYELACGDSPTSVPALALVQKSQLESRIAAILAPIAKSPSRVVTPLLCGLLLLGALAGAISVPMSKSETRAIVCREIRSQAPVVSSSWAGQTRDLPSRDAPRFGS